MEQTQQQANHDPTQAVINELAVGAKTEEDRAVISEWQKETDAKRVQASANLGRGALELAIMPDGTVVPADLAREVMQSGGSAHPYGDKGRRA